MGSGLVNDAIDICDDGSSRQPVQVPYLTVRECNAQRMLDLLDQVIRIDPGLYFGQTTKVGRLAMADDKGGSPGKVGRPFVKFLQSKKYAYD